MHKTDSDFQAYFEKLKNATNEAQFEDVISFCESLEAQGRDLNALEYFYGYALLALNRDQAALKPLSRALKFFPNEVNLLNRIAICCRRLRNFGDASRYFERALSIEGNNEVLIVNYLVNLLEALQSDSAIQVATEALARFPANRMIRIQLATAYLNSWRPSHALKVLEPLKLTAQLGEVGLTCMVSCFVRLRQNDEARKVLLQLFELNPNSPEALALSAHVSKDAGEIEVATELYRQALDRLPQNHELFSSMLFCLLHDAEKTNDEILQVHREFSKRFESTLAKTAQFENEKSKNRKLRIGFISGDLCKHPVAAFVLPIFSKFDSSRFELIAFNNSMQEDEYSLKLKGSFSSWSNVWSMQDDELASMIRAQKIDILVDLSGHTARNRILVLGRKPAPIQMTWIGYPCTTGLDAMDYALTDIHISPTGLYDAHWVEKFIRLPVLQAFEIKQDLPDVGPLPALQKGYVCFGSFNRPEKIGPRVIHLWAQALHAVPGSRMLLANMSDRKARRRIANLFLEYGVPTDRLDFYDTSPEPVYLALHQHVDFILDAFPWAGSTITCIALQMGVPTLSLRGNSRVSCNGNAILERHGLSEWVAEDERDFVNKARHFASQLDSLAKLRAALRPQVHAQLADNAEKIARYMEIAFRVVWQRWCEGLPVEALDLTEMCIRETSLI